MKYAFHILVEDGLCTLTMTELHFDRLRAYKLLLTMQSEFFDL